MARKGLLANPWLWVGLAAAGFFWYRSRNKQTTIVDDIVTPDDTAPELPAPNPGAEILPGGTLSKRDFIIANGGGKTEEWIDRVSPGEFEVLYTWLHDYRNAGRADQAPAEIVNAVALIGLKYEHGFGDKVKTGFE